MANPILMTSSGTGSPASSFTTADFVPPQGSMLVVLASYADSFAFTSPASIVGDTGKALSILTDGARRTNLDSLFIYTADGFSNAVSQHVTIDLTADNASAVTVAVIAVTGLALAGYSAAFNYGAQQNQASSVPAPTLNFGNAQTTNLTIGVVSTSAASSFTPPVGWNELTTINSPGPPMEIVYRLSGFSGSTITWGASVTPDYNDTIIEFNGIGGGPGASLLRDRTRTQFP